jgi:MFS family permease
VRSPSQQALSGNILVFTLTDLVGNFARSMVFPYASLFILALGGDAALIGLVAFLSQLAGLVLLPIAGHISDHADRVHLIVLAGVITSLPLLIMILTPGWQGIALASLLTGMVVFQFPAYASLMADSLSAQGRGQGFGVYRVFSSWLAIFGPFLGGAIIQRYSTNLGIRILYSVMLVIYLVSTFFQMRFLKETSHTPREALRLPVLWNALTRSYRGIPGLVRLMPGPLRALALVVVLCFVMSGLTGSFWVVYATGQQGLTVEEWGLILLIEAVAKLALFIPAGYIVERRGRSASLIVALAIYTLATPLFALAHGFTPVLFARLVMAVAYALASLACLTLMADLTPRRTRGQGMAALGQGGIELGAVGAPGGPALGYLIIPPLMIASLASGLLYTLNPAAPWAGSTIAGLAALAISAAFIRDPERAEE